MKSFSESFSFESYSILTKRGLEPSEYQKLFADLLIPAFGTFFFELVEAGRIVPADTLGREIRLIAYWNRAVTKDEYYEHSIHDIAWKILHHPMFMSGMLFEKEENGLKKGYDLFISQMDAGNIPFTSSDNEDNITGENFQLEIKNWVPMFYQYGKGTEHVPATQLAPVNPIDTVEVKFESGEVLVADWFRIDEFTSKTKNDASINNDRGIREAVNHYAALGFVSVFVGNSCPNVWKRGNTVIVGRSADCDVDIENGQEMSVCTDLWWVTMIDRKQLERMVGVEIAAKYIADHDTDILNLEPGTYTVSYTPKYHNFGDHFKSESFDMTGIEAFFALEKK
jgi:hypothetical protein